MVDQHGHPTLRIQGGMKLNQAINETSCALSNMLFHGTYQERRLGHVSMVEQHHAHDDVVALQPIQRDQQVPQPAHTYSSSRQAGSKAKRQVGIRFVVLLPTQRHQQVPQPAHTAAAAGRQEVKQAGGYLFCCAAAGSA
jgi:hypothetical protein